MIVLRKSSKPADAAYTPFKTTVEVGTWNRAVLEVQNLEAFPTNAMAMHSRMHCGDTKPWFVAAGLSYAPRFRTGFRTVMDIVKHFHKVPKRVDGADIWVAPYHIIMTLTWHMGI